jgi:hypothetical protein
MMKLTGNAPAGEVFMKIDKKLSGLLCCCLLVITVVLSGGCGAKSGTDAYRYPAVPGSDEWNDFTTLGEMIAACQVPEDTLKAMSTKGLVETAINYPLLGNIVFSNDKQGALNDVLRQSNAIQELLLRPDAPAELLAKYRSMDPAVSTDDWTDYDRLFYPVKFTGIEIIMAQDVMLVLYTPAQQQEIIELAKAKYQAKKQSALFTNAQLPDSSNVLIVRLQQSGK